MEDGIENVISGGDASSGPRLRTLTVAVVAAPAGQGVAGTSSDTSRSGAAWYSSRPQLSAPATSVSGINGSRTPLYTGRKPVPGIRTCCQVSPSSTDRAKPAADKVVTQIVP